MFDFSQRVLLLTGANGGIGRGIARLFAEAGAKLVMADIALQGAEEFARSFAFSDQVQQEDIAICEAVQKGLRSRTYVHGRYSVKRENGVHHFHGLLTAALKGAYG